MKQSKGFTLIELIVVISIISVLAAVAAPAYSKVRESAERSVCQSQMTQMLKLFSYHLIAYPGGNLEDALAGKYDDLADNFALHECPSGGVYQVDEDGNLMCTVHGSAHKLWAGSSDHNNGNNNNGGSGQTYPNTNINICDSYWPTEDDYLNLDDPNGDITVEAGGVFLYNGEYYIVTRDVSMNQYNACIGEGQDGPGGNVLGWYSTEKLTGTVYNMDNFTGDGGELNGVTRGDIVEVNGEYYVFNDGGTVAHDPLDQGQYQWYKIPSS